MKQQDFKDTGKFVETIWQHKNKTVTAMIEKDCWIPRQKEGIKVEDVMQMIIIKINSKCSKILRKRIH